VFGFQVPVHVPGVDGRLLDPRSTWRDPADYDRKAQELAGMFVANFAKRFGEVGESIRIAGPSA
jgi:phosphoenolpyruvate carboxykinase (ATP)